jgi:hypothetical protein
MIYSRAFGNTRPNATRQPVSGEVLKYTRLGEPLNS